MSIIVSVGFGLTLMTVLMVIFEDRFIYFPSLYPEGNWNPETYGLNPRDCYFTSSDGVRLHGWFFQADSPKTTFIWCHGNAGNITHRLDNISRLLPLGVNVFIFDYRGYGRSEGKPSEEGIYEDARAAYDYVVGTLEIDPSSIVFFGRSLGAVVAIHLARDRRCRGLIVESGFPSAKEMAKSLFPFLPLHLFVRSKFDAASAISRVHAPILFIHGTDDRTVPIHLGKNLFEHANEPKQFYEIPGADHNNTYLVGGRAYFERLRAFIDQFPAAR